VYDPAGNIEAVTDGAAAADSPVIADGMRESPSTVCTTRSARSRSTCAKRRPPGSAAASSGRCALRSKSLATAFSPPQPLTGSSVYATSIRSDVATAMA